MEDLKIKGEVGTYFTPTVSFIASNGMCKIEGESYLEDSFDFYDKLGNWIQDFFEAGNTKLVLDFKLIYFNTSSSRAILDLLRKLKDLKEAGKDVTVNWMYPNPDDDELLIEGEDFIDESSFEMNLIEYDMD